MLNWLIVIHKNAYTTAQLKAFTDLAIPENEQKYIYIQNIYLIYYNANCVQKTSNTI